MLQVLFQGILDAGTGPEIPVLKFLICIVCALLLGLVIAFSYMYRSRYTGSFVVTLALLPAIVCVVILLVNGSIGAGVAVAGAFSLVRFRSAQGTAKEICMLFLAMGTGLTAGMGYLAYAVLFTLLLCGVQLLYRRLGLGVKRQSDRERTLTITIPETLDYTHVFDDIFADFTSASELTAVKTTHMGSLLRLSYRLTLADPAKEKQLLDQLRCRNGNLEITLSRWDADVGEL